MKGGPSPNPKGRPRAGNALAEVIRTEIDPRALVGVAVRILGDAKASADVKLRAATFLRDSGYVRPAQSHELVVRPGSNEEDDVDYALATNEELERLEQMEAERTAILVAIAGRAALPTAEES